MRVDDGNRAEGGKWQPARASQEAQRAERTEDSGSLAGPVEGGGGDHLRLSGVSGRIREAFQSFSETHAARVESIGARVRSGEYRVDAQALSRAMLAADLGSAE